MEAQYKIVTRTAQLVTKEVSQEEVNEMLATLTRIKEQLSKVAEYFFYYTLLTVELISSKLPDINAQICMFEQMYSYNNNRLNSGWRKCYFL